MKDKDRRFRGDNSDLSYLKTQNVILELVFMDKKIIVISIDTSMFIIRYNKKKNNVEP